MRPLLPSRQEAEHEDRKCRDRKDPRDLTENACDLRYLCGLIGCERR
jgi:hypothetical protein